MRGKGAPKFAMSKIKRIMQTDDEVGKVSTETIHAMSKCLELLIQELVESAAEEATTANAKSVGRDHLQKAVKGNSRFDFLIETVAAGIKKRENPTSEEKGQKGPRSKKPKVKVMDDEVELSEEEEESILPKPEIKDVSKPEKETKSELNTSNVSILTCSNDRVIKLDEDYD